MPLYFEDLMMVVNKDGFETNRRGVSWTETAMEINIPSLTLLSRKRSGGEKSQPNKREQGQGAFFFFLRRTCPGCVVSTRGALICWSAEACCGGGVWFLCCQKKAHMPHGGCSQWQIQTAVTCRSFCPLYMCSGSSRRWRRTWQVNTGGFDPGRLGDGGQTSLKRIDPHEKVDFLNVYYVVMPAFTLFTSLNAVNFFKMKPFLLAQIMCKRTEDDIHCIRLWFGLFIFNSSCFSCCISATSERFDTQ